MAVPALPAGVVLLERGWLSSNSLLVVGREQAGIVDSGYSAHAPQTVELVRSAVRGLPLTDLVNTHLHSDHCGGNAALQAAFPSMRTWIPPGQAVHVRDWDPVALTYVPTGQSCPPFRLDGTLTPGTSVVLGDRAWEVHAAPGHDPHSVILFEPETRLLASADALWENGFGIVFPELEGERAFDAVADTLDMIEQLRPAWVAPGHGRAFDDVSGALARARARLAAYTADPRRHAAYAAKVLLKFKLLEVQEQSADELLDWAGRTPYFQLVHARWFPAGQLRAWLSTLLEDLVRSGAAQRDGAQIRNG